MAKHTASWWSQQVMIAANLTFGDKKHQQFAYDTVRELIELTKDDYSKASEKARVKLDVLLNRLNEERYGNPTPRIKRGKAARQPSQLTGDAPNKRLIARRKKTAAQPMPGVWANPLTRVKVSSPPQRGGDLTPRLSSRRKTTKKAPDGFYANPAPAFPYRVESRAPNARGWLPRGSFRTAVDAKQYAHAFANLHSEMSVRVVTSDTAPFSIDKHLRSVK